MRKLTLLAALAVMVMLPCAPLFAQRKDKPIPTLIVFEAERYTLGGESCELFGKPPQWGMRGANCPIELKIRGRDYRPAVYGAYTGTVNYLVGPSDILQVNRDKPLKVEGLNPALLHGLSPSASPFTSRTLVVWGYWSRATNTFGVVQTFRGPNPVRDTRIKHY